MINNVYYVILVLTCYLIWKIFFSYLIEFRKLCNKYGQKNIYLLYKPLSSIRKMFALSSEQQGNSH